MTYLDVWDLEDLKKRSRELRADIDNYYHIHNYLSPAQIETLINKQNELEIIKSEIMRRREEDR